MSNLHKSNDKKVPPKIIPEETNLPFPNSVLAVIEESTIDRLILKQVL
jgi:hypothetical protein